MSGGAIDWEALRRRVREAGERLERGAALSPDEARRVLEQRARRLAHAGGGMDAASREASVDLVVFTLARQRYAVESRHALAAFHLERLTPLPGAPAPLHGVTAWRGDVLTVLDLRALVGAPTGALDDLAHVVVVGALDALAADGGERGAIYGLLADAVHGVQTWALAELLPPPETRAPLRAVTRDAVHLLDVPALVRRLDASSPDSRPTP
jgi:purine-binding chemotaxis protein CheW